MNLKDLLAKDPSSLNAEEKEFLKANLDQLTEEDKTKFQSALEEGLGVEAVKSMMAGVVDEQLEKKLEKKFAALTDMLSKKFQSGVEAQRAKIASGEPPAKNQKADDKTRAFIKALLSGDRVAAKALTTTTSGETPDDAQAGLTIPPELMAEVLRIKETQYGLARRDMRYLPFSGPGNSRTIPALGTSVSVFWTGEGARKKGTQPKFSLVTQTLKKLAAIVPMTEEILEDSAINLTTLVADLFAEATSKEEDIQFFSGTGSPWTGILNNGDVNKVTQASGGVDDITADDLLDMQDATPSSTLNGSKYYMHRTVLSKVRKLKGTDGQYIYQNPGGSLPATIWNYPVETSDAFPAVADVETGDQYVIFGNLKQAAIFGDKQQLRVKLLDQATVTDEDDESVINLAEQDMIAVRVVERVGYVLALPKAVTVLEAGEPNS